MRRLLTTTSATLVALLVLAPTAFAHDGGEGLWGETNDKVTTFAGFILIVFFPTFVFLMSMLQAHLDKRKYARKSAEKARGASAQWRGGW